MVVPDDMSWDTVQETFSGRGWTDGLPVVPPTAARVAAMLNGWSPNDSLGSMPPSQKPVTAEAVAVQCVMAGCKPEYFPVVWSALAAMLQPEFNLLGIQTTTGNATPVIMVNGPIRSRLQINSGSNCMGPHFHANATIGRAIRLCLANIGGARPGVMDMATMGQPAKFTFCFAENEENSPWPPFPADQGFPARTSTVTVFSCAGLYEIVDTHSRTATDTLELIGASLLPLGTLGVNGLSEGGSGLLVLAPETAHLLAGAGLRKEDVARRLYEMTTVSPERLPAAVREALIAINSGNDLPAPIRLFKSPEHLFVAVAGGVGIKSTFIPGWGGGSHPVTMPIQ